MGKDLAMLSQKVVEVLTEENVEWSDSWVKKSIKALTKGLDWVEREVLLKEVFEFAELIECEEVLGKRLLVTNMILPRTKEGKEMKLEYDLSVKSF